MTGTSPDPREVDYVRRSAVVEVLYEVWPDATDAALDAIAGRVLHDLDVITRAAAVDSPPNPPDVRAAWYAKPDDEDDESPSEVYWDTYRDCWEDGYETGWRAAGVPVVAPEPAPRDRFTEALGAAVVIPIDENGRWECDCGEIGLHGINLALHRIRRHGDKPAPLVDADTHTEGDALEG